jgi:hypothetical protein
MADDPWAQFVPGAAKPSAPAAVTAPAPAPKSSGADPWAQFASPTTSAPTSPAPGGTPPPAAPSSPSPNDIVLQHLASSPWLPGAAWLHDATRTATDWPTFGLADKLFGAQAQADTAAAKQRMGAAALPLEIAGSAVTGQGELAGAKALGEAAAPLAKLLPFTGQGNWLGGVLGSGAVGAGTSALGAYGHEQGWTPDVSDIGNAAKWGLGFGMLGGVPGGVVGRGGALPAAVPTSTLAATQEQAFKDAGDVLFNNADIRQKATQALTDIGAAAPRVSIEGQGAQNVLNDLTGEALGKGAMSAERVNDYINKLHNFNTGDAVPVAGQIGQGHLNDLLTNTTPALGGAAGAGADAVEAAKTATARFRDTSRLEEWQGNAAVAGGPSVADQASSWLRSAEGQRFAPPGSPLYDATNRLAGTPVPPKLSATPSAWDVRHVLSHVIEPVALGITGGAAGGATGGWDLGHMAEGAGTALAGGYLVHKGLPAFQNLTRSGPYQAAQDAARVVASTGLRQAPIRPLTPVRDALRMLGVYGPAAGGAF